MTEPREIEAKYEADQPSLEQLLALNRFGEWSVERQPEKLQQDIYFDSAAEHLKEHGASLRIRRKGQAVLMTFKGDRVVTATAVSRLEDEVPIDADCAVRFEQTGDWQGQLPSPLFRARELTGDVPLMPFACLQTSRTVMIATHPNGAQVELSVDRCSGTRTADGRQVGFVEVEAELHHGTLDDLVSSLDQLVATVPGLRPSIITKLERTMR